MSISDVLTRGSSRENNFYFIREPSEPTAPTAPQTPPPVVPTFVSGMIIPFAGNTPPDGWLLCNGQSCLVAEYPDLFFVIGTKFGSAGIDSFNVPNLKDRFLKGTGQIDNIGETGGTSTHTHGDHAAITHTGFSVSDHPSVTHTGTAIGNHTVTQPNAHGTQAIKYGTSGTSLTVLTNTNNHLGANVSAHSVTQPAAHPAVSHSVTAADNHVIDSHSTVNHEPNYLVVNYIIKA